ncbi:hypothetical protein N9M68_00725 [Candidatus Poseidonia alphae]|nr:hypothetical protein [Candidatus Poseidonia alphae]
MGAGYPINFALSPGGETRLKQNALYVKYASSTFGNIDLATLKADLAGVMATAQSAEICAYLSWLVRTKVLSAP